MTNLYGLVHTSPYSFVQRLKEITKDYQVVMTSTKLREHKCYIVVGSSVLNRVKEEIPETSIVFLIDNPLMCSRYKELTILDVHPSAVSYQFEFKDVEELELKAIIKSNSVLAITIEDKPLAATILQEIPQSAISTIQEFVYKVSDNEKRARYQFNIFEAIRDGVDIRTMPWFKEKTASHSTLGKWWNGEGAELIAVLQKALTIKESFDYEKQLANLKVSKFDVKYSKTVLAKFATFQSETTVEEEHRKSRKPDEMGKPITKLDKRKRTA